MISPVKFDYLNASAHVSPEAPPPTITYLVLLFGSLLAIGSGSPLGKTAGTFT